MVALDGGPDGGPNGGPDGGPDGGPNCGPDGGPDGGPNCGPDSGGPDGRWYGTNTIMLHICDQIPQFQKPTTNKIKYDNYKIIPCEPLDVINDVTIGVFQS